jgi:hypothetical protein
MRKEPSLIATPSGGFLAPAGSRSYLVFESNSFRIVFCEPGLRGVGGRKDLNMIGLADLLARVDVKPDCFHEASRLIR